MKTFNQAPLPFQGQKRNFVRHFKEALRDYPSDATYVDLFGGSGLLSHTVKSQFPNAQVVYNDFDNYRKRLENIPNTNAILDELRALELTTPRGEKIDGADKIAVLKVLKNANKKGFVDWITISASVKFSMNYGIKYEDFANDTLYNKIRKTNYDTSESYLNGIEVVKYVMYHYKTQIKNE